MNNIKQKNVINSIESTRNIPHESSNSLKLQQNSSITSSRINNLVQQLVNNDLYVENVINCLKENSVGPKPSDESIIVKSKNGSKFFYDPQRTELQILMKSNEDIQKTLSGRLGTKNVNFIVKHENFIWIGTDKGLYLTQDMKQFKKDETLEKASAFYSDGFNAYVSDGTYVYVAKLDGEYNVVLNMMHEQEIEGIICSISIDKSHSVMYLGTESGTVVYGTVSSGKLNDIRTIVEFDENKYYDSTINLINVGKINALENIQGSELESSTIAATENGMYRQKKVKSIINPSINSCESDIRQMVSSGDIMIVSDRYSFYGYNTEDDTMETIIDMSDIGLEIADFVIYKGRLMFIGKNGMYEVVRSESSVQLNDFKLNVPYGTIFHKMMMFSKDGSDMCMISTNRGTYLLEIGKSKSFAMVYCGDEANKQVIQQCTPSDKQNTYTMVNSTDGQYVISSDNSLVCVNNIESIYNDYDSFQLSTIAQNTGITKILCHDNSTFAARGRDLIECTDGKMSILYTSEKDDTIQDICLFGDELYFISGKKILKTNTSDINIRQVAQLENKVTRLAVSQNTIIAKVTEDTSIILSKKPDGSYLVTSCPISYQYIERNTIDNESEFVFLSSGTLYGTKKYDKIQRYSDLSVLPGVNSTFNSGISSLISFDGGLCVAITPQNESQYGTILDEGLSSRNAYIFDGDIYNCTNNGVIRHRGDVAETIVSGDISQFMDMPSPENMNFEILSSNTLLKVNVQTSCDVVNSLSSNVAITKFQKDGDGYIYSTDMSVVLMKHDEMELIDLTSYVNGFHKIEGTQYVAYCISNITTFDVDSHETHTIFNSNRDMVGKSYLYQNGSNKYLLLGFDNRIAYVKNPTDVETTDISNLISDDVHIEGDDIYTINFMDVINGNTLVYQTVSSHVEIVDEQAIATNEYKINKANLVIQDEVLSVSGQITRETIPVQLSKSFHTDDTIIAYAEGILFRTDDYSTFSAIDLTDFGFLYNYKVDDVTEKENHLLIKTQQKIFDIDDKMTIANLGELPVYGIHDKFAVISDGTMLDFNNGYSYEYKSVESSYMDGEIVRLSDVIIDDIRRFHTENGMKNIAIISGDVYEFQYKDNFDMFTKILDCDGSCKHVEFDSRNGIMYTELGDTAIPLKIIPKNLGESNEYKVMDKILTEGEMKFFSVGTSIFGEYSDNDIFMYTDKSAFSTNLTFAITNGKKYRNDIRLITTDCTDGEIYTVCNNSTKLESTKEDGITFDFEREIENVKVADGVGFTMNVNEWYYADMYSTSPQIRKLGSDSNIGIEQVEYDGDEFYITTRDEKLMKSETMVRVTYHADVKQKAPNIELSSIIATDEDGNIAIRTTQDDFIRFNSQSGDVKDIPSFLGYDVLNVFFEDNNCQKRRFTVLDDGRLMCSDSFGEKSEEYPMIYGRTFDITGAMSNAKKNAFCTGNYLIAYKEIGYQNIFRRISQDDSGFNGMCRRSGNEFYSYGENGIYSFGMVDGLFTDPYIINSNVTNVNSISRKDGYDEKYAIASEGTILTSTDGRICNTILSIDQTINVVHYEDDSTMVIGTDDEIYATEYMYSLSNDFYHFSEKDFDELYENMVSGEFQTIADISLENHQKYHSPDQLIGMINQKMRTDAENCNIKTDWNDDMTEYKDDIVDSVEFGDNTNGVIRIECENFLQSDKNLKFKYIQKNHSSGIREILIFIPTTYTYYIPHIDGSPNCSLYNQQLFHKNLQRFGLEKATFSGELSGHCTNFNVFLDNAYFQILNMMEVQVNGNSLPLKIYKDQDNEFQEGQPSNMFHSFIEPSVSTGFKISRDITEQKEHQFGFVCFGTDSQAIRIQFLDDMLLNNYSYFWVQYNSIETTQDTYRQVFIMSDNCRRSIREMNFVNQGKRIVGWRFTKNPKDKQQIDIGSDQKFGYEDIPYNIRKTMYDKCTVNLYAVWSEEKELENSILTIQSDGTEFGIERIGLDTSVSPNDSVIIKYN